LTNESRLVTGWQTMPSLTNQSRFVYLGERHIATGIDMQEFLLHQPQG